MRFETAIEHLVDNYRYAKSKVWIRDEVAWALYHTWKEADDRKDENCSEKPNNCEHITKDGVTCAKYPACDDCLDNPLNKVKGSKRLLKGKTEPQTDCGDFADRLAYERGVKHAWKVAQKVFNSTVTFYEAEDVAKQIDKDINVRSKDCETCKHYKLACELFSEICKYEPTTQTETQNSNLTFETDECAKEYEELGLKELKELINADRKTEQTEPQTERGSE